MNSLSLFCRYSQNDVFVNSGVRCRLKSQPLPTISILTWNIFLSLEVRELGDRSPYSFYGLFTFSWLSDAASLMIHIALFHWRPKGDRCCKHQSLLPRFVRRVWRMLPFCIDDPADLHIAYIAAAGFGSFSLMARSNTLLLQMALPCSWPYDLILSVPQTVRNRCYRQIILCLGVRCVELELAWHYSWSHGQLDDLGKLCVMLGPQE